MSLPEIDCVTKCATRYGYRKLLLGLLVAITTFSFGVWVSSYMTPRRIVRTTLKSHTFLQPHTLKTLSKAPFHVTHRYDLFSSPDGAAKEFELQIHEASGYREIRACHDQNGVQIGRRVLLMNPVRKGDTGFWRIIWTQQNENSSELFSVESDSLEQLRAIEGMSRPNWKLCLQTSLLPGW